jgi:outer membrane protein W
MKLARLLVVCLAISAAPAAVAQKWEVGGGAGGGFHTSKDLTRPTETATASIKTGVAASAWLANNTNNRWGGEIRYTYQMGDLQLKQGSTTASFGGETHTMGYDFQWHATDINSASRPYIAFGAGAKVFRGTGTETLTQPLSRFALLTRTREIQGMISVGAGVKVKTGRNWQLRLDVHDYISRYPAEVMQPNVGTQVGGWMHNIVPSIGFSWAK